MFTSSSQWLTGLVTPIMIHQQRLASYTPNPPALRTAGSAIRPRNTPADASETPFSPMPAAPSTRQSRLAPPRPGPVRPENPFSVGCVAGFALPAASGEQRPSPACVRLRRCPTPPTVLAFLIVAERACILRPILHFLTYLVTLPARILDGTPLIGYPAVSFWPDCMPSREGRFWTFHPFRFKKTPHGETYHENSAHIMCRCWDHVDCVQFRVGLSRFS